MTFWLDFIGASLSLTCTYYFTQAKRLAWLIGCFAIIFNSILYWQKGIYGHLLLESIYLISMIIGWYQWSNSNKKESKPLLIRRLSLNQIYIISFFAVCAIAIMAQVLRSLTDTDIPYWDASTTVLSLIAQTLLCFKFIHCWILWFIVDALIAILQLYKGIPFHSAIHWMYLIMAVMGYYKWHKIYQNQALPCPLSI